MNKLFLFIILFIGNNALAQRIYAPQSVFNNGFWYKIVVQETGIYKLDIAFLNNCGINTNNLNSNAIKIYGNTGKMLDENNSNSRYDDIQENAIQVNDGGDGIINGNDYILFYASNNNYWLKDSLQKKFTHQKNLYTNETVYFINISTNGKRIIDAINPNTFNNTASTYDERYFFEENKTNLLNSGKEWIGNEYSNLPGRQLSNTYSVQLKNVDFSFPLNITTNTFARSNNNSTFEVKVNNTVVQQLYMPSVASGSLNLYATTTILSSNYISNTNTQNINFTYMPNSATAQGWLNWFEIQHRTLLTMNNQPQLMFRDWNSVANNSITKYIISNANSTIQVWDVSNPTQPIKQNGLLNASNFQFNQNSNYLREYIAFDNFFYIPTFKGIISNQNLHQSTPIDFLIITNENLKPAAEVLANHHKVYDNMDVAVVTVNKIYNEFSSGMQDVTAIRDFIKMYYDKYKNTTKPLKNVLFLGDASYDYLDRINNNTNLVPCWETTISNDPLLTYISDDFFGYLDDHENINDNITNLLDVGIGRVPAKNIEEANNYINKVINYTTTKSLGAWRNQMSLIADDEDGNLHLNDAEVLSNTISTTNNTFIQNKIYLDAYKQESGSGGSRYPLVNETINNKIFNGNIIMNYSGHGGNRRLADEAIIDVDMINNWKNENRLPLFITATCDFAPYDDPQDFSIGENLLLKPKAGAIALMTTTRVVFAYSNRIMNTNYLQFALQRNTQQKYPNLGEANRLAKNYTTSNNGDIVNNRKFTLLGDPALTIAYPKYYVKTTKINDHIFSTYADTIKATNTIKIDGEVQDYSNTTINSFTGKIDVTIYDKQQSTTTLANDAGSTVTNFQSLGNILYKGAASVLNGKFSISFVSPKDMQYNYGLGYISYYAQNDSIDANGKDDIIVGGATNNIQLDKEGPIIKPYLNDTKFINGSLTNANPILYVLFEDSSGINTSNIGIGHEITLVIDNEINKTIVLNDFYNAAINNYKKGSLQYQLPNLKEGVHSIIIKAWDVYNNSNQSTLEFIVGNDNKLVIDKVLNYPNPFTTKTSFWFEHNKPNEDLEVSISIFSITGKLVKQIQETINTKGNRSCDINWDGKDEYQAPLAKGTYFYQLKVKNKKGDFASKIEKIFKF
jgi:Peptidase family C25